jgi:hypothetical protein
MADHDLYDSTKETMPFDRWNWLLCRRADFSARLWPTNRSEMYEEGLTITQAMLKAYPDWSPGK